MRKPIIIGNWKMNMSLKGGLSFLSKLEKNVNEKIEVGIAVQSVSLVNMISQSNNVLIGAQNCFYEDAGPYTGEISPVLLKEIKTKFCLVGHSERRALFNETNEMVNKKACKLLENNITPVICVGEMFEEHEKKQNKETISKQIKECCQNLKIENCIIAYEPVWAIGTGEIPRLDEIQAIGTLIRAELTKMYSAKQAEQVRIQYGGSVSEENIKQLLELEDIDGALVGGASLKIKSFSKLISA
jgi:triosephosphate isomerase (TIM)